MIWPGDALVEQGFDVSVIRPSDPFDTQLQAKHVNVDGVERLLTMDAPDADVVVIQRPLKHSMLDGITMMRSHGIKVVVEVDDDFSAIDPRNAAFWACQPTQGVYVYPDGTEKPTGGPDRNWQHLAAACRIADMVTVTTPALARRYGSHGRVRIIPNCVPESYLEIESPPHDDVVVGWAGSVHSHPTDPKVVGAGIRQAMAATGATFRNVGTGTGVKDGFHLAEEPFSTGYVPLSEYPHAVACFDIGLVPLVDSAFNRAKSSLKMLEYAALGVVPVVSPTPDNLRMERLGLGMVADKPKDWQRSVTRLARDADLRAEWKTNVRARASMYTYENRCEMWWDAWSDALNQSSRGSRTRSVTC